MLGIYVNLIIIQNSSCPTSASSGTWGRVWTTSRTHTCPNWHSVQLPQDGTST